MRRHVGEGQGRVARPHADDRARVLAEPRVGRGDDGDLGDAGQRLQRALDLGGGDVLAAADDDVLHPIGDGQEALLVEHADVAGVVPPLVVERGGGERRVGVAEAEIGTAREDLAGRTRRARRRRRRRRGAARRPRSARPSVRWRRSAGSVEPRARGRRMLGRPVRADDGDAVRGRALGESDRHGRAAEADPVHQGGVVGREVGVVEEAREEHRCAGAGADARLEHHLERVGGIPAVDQVDVLARRERAQHAEHPGRVGHRASPSGWASRG